jgi:hypothetical protein
LAALTARDRRTSICRRPGRPERKAPTIEGLPRDGILDLAFTELGRKISEDFEPMSYHDVELLIAKIGSTLPEAIAYIGAMLRRQGVATE